MLVESEPGHGATFTIRFPEAVASGSPWGGRRPRRYPAPRRRTKSTMMLPGEVRDAVRLLPAGSTTRSRPLHRLTAGMIIAPDHRTCPIATAGCYHRVRRIRARRSS